MDLNGTVLLVSCQMRSQVPTTSCYKERQAYTQVSFTEGDPWWQPQI